MGEGAKPNTQHVLLSVCLNFWEAAEIDMAGLHVWLHTRVCKLLRCWVYLLLGHKRCSRSLEKRWSLTLFQLSQYYDMTVGWDVPIVSSLKCNRRGDLDLPTAVALVSVFRCSHFNILSSVLIILTSPAVTDRSHTFFCRTREHILSAALYIFLLLALCF